jgi:signal transduction histidine kinase
MACRAANARVEAAAALAREARLRRDLFLVATRSAHDLSEPARLMSTFIGMIEHGPPRFTAEENHYLEFVNAGLARMRRLIAYLAAYGQIGGDSEAAFRNVAMDVPVALALHTLRPELDGAGTEVQTIEPLPVVRGNLQRLQELMVSLFTNAIKYRKPGDAGTVRIQAHRFSPHEWAISVADNGIGIDPQYHERIFQPFQRLHGRDIPGNGMGLALASKIVEAHGGRLWVESAPGQGAQFIFTLPVLAAQDEAPIPS